MERFGLWGLLIGVFLVSSSVLAFEIILSRILSVVLSHTYVFVIVSVALLGLGAGGIFVGIFRSRRPITGQRPASLAVLSSLIALSIPVSVILIAQIAQSAGIAGNIVVYSVLLIIPFSFVGAVLAEVLRTFPLLSSRVYGADLLGAAAGSLGAILLLDNLGAINGAFALGLGAALGALLVSVSVLGHGVRRIALPAGSLATVVVILAVNVASPYLPDVPIGQSKAIQRVLENPGGEGEIVAGRGKGEIIETRWSAFGRTDLVASSQTPDDMTIYIDGTAGSFMYRFSGDVDNPGAAFEDLEGFAGYQPLRFLRAEEKDSLLAIGSGGGRDVLLALMAGVGAVTAVEVNADLVQIVREYAWYNGGIYSGIDSVGVVVAEGRNFLRSQAETYDLIMLSLPVTRTSRSPEGYALTESYLLTTESIGDYLDHLTDEGRLVVVGHDLRAILRTLSISLAALEERGVSAEAALERVYWLNSEQFPVFVMKKTPFEATEMRSVHRAIHELGYDLSFTFIPTIRIVVDDDNDGDYDAHTEEDDYSTCSRLLPLQEDRRAGGVDITDMEALLAAEGVDISPVTDDSPFFYKFETGLPSPVKIVLVSSSVMTLVVLALPFLSRRREHPRGQRRRAATLPPIGSRVRFAVLFMMLGAGFMLAEISLVQKLVLFLGQPVLALAILLASLLTGLGIGSLCSGRVGSGRMVRVIATVSVSTVVVLVGYALLLPTIFQQLLGSYLAVRLLVAGMMLTPLGFLMGFPFPMGIRLLKEMGADNQIPWMWGLNGMSSVLGSAAAMAIAMSLGLTGALLAAAGCYLVIFLTFAGFRRGRGLVPLTESATSPPAGTKRRRKR